ncbi:MAG: permease [Chloroflexota bacterium]
MLMDSLKPGFSLPDVAKVSAPARSRSSWSGPAQRWLLLVLLLGAAAIILENVPTDSLGSRFQVFVTIFLSIFIEAAPFLLAGSLVSGLIEVAVNQETLYRFIPRQPVLAALAGGALGLVFPVCECGVVPVTRRLYQKGLPLSVGIAFLLAAPVINPIVLASTYAAFGWGPVLWGRFGLSFLIASVIGLLFYVAAPGEVILPEVTATHPDGPQLGHVHRHGPHCDHNHELEDRPPGSQIWKALAIAGDDFLDMARYLVAGSLLAAGMQTLAPQPVLLALGGNALTSIVAMLALAFVLSVCSTVDAFLALAFVNTFPSAAILAFLVFGPMVDIKSSLMFLGVFRRRAVAYLILLPLLATLVITLYLNLNVRW